MKFVFIVTNLQGGGAEKAILKLATGLLARAHQVTLVLLEDKVAHEIPAGLEVVPLVSGKSASKGWIGKRLLAYKLRRLLDRIGTVNLCVSTLPFADEVSRLAKLPRHWCRIANTLSVEISKLPESKRVRRLSRYRTGYGGASLIAVSSGVKSDLQNSLGIRSRIETIPNPFDFDAIRLAAKEACDLPTRPYVVHVGRFNPQKRHDLLLDAWRQLDTSHILVLLTEQNPELDDMIKARGLEHRVMVAGFKPNPYPWMANAALLVLCSDHEGLPNVLIEALICGTPVVSTDCPSGPREIIGQALSQALCPCGDVNALAAAIRTNLSSPPDLSVIDLARYTAQTAIDAYEALAREAA